MFRAFVELPRAGTAQRRARTIENRREPEQRRGQSSTSPSPQRDRTSNLNKRPPPPPMSGRKLGAEETSKQAKQTKGTALEGAGATD